LHGQVAEVAAREEATASAERVMASPGDRYETVHTMEDYYDGPREGFADVEGKPHFYVST
jgi:hypothetical protein